MAANRLQRSRRNGLVRVRQVPSSLEFVPKKQQRLAAHLARAPIRRFNSNTDDFPAIEVVGSHRGRMESYPSLPGSRIALQCSMCLSTIHVNLNAPVPTSQSCGRNDDAKDNSDQDPPPASQDRWLRHFD